MAGFSVNLQLSFLKIMFGFVGSDEVQIYTTAYAPTLGHIIRETPTTIK
jgi:hypothetical protein